MFRDEWRWWLVVDENGNIIDGFNSHDGAVGYVEDLGSYSDGWIVLQVEESEDA